MPGEKTLSHQFVDSTPPKLGDHYYVRVTLSNGSYAYTSPVFVEKDANPQSQLSYDQPNKLQSWRKNEIPSHHGSGLGH